METQKESAGQLDLLFLLQWNKLSVHLTCPPPAVANFIFHFSLLQQAELAADP